MGSIGDVFPYANMTNGMASWGPRIVEITDELIDRCSSPVPISALSGSSLDMDNNEIINVKDIQFQEQSSAPTVNPGGIYYLNGEWYVVTATGAIQFTDAGAINVTTAGAIGGDYGLGPEQVRFVNADQRYDFYDDYAGGAWGYIRGLGFDVAAGAASAFRARILYTGAANLSFTLPATIPAANRSLLQVDPSGLITYNSAAARVTNDIYISGQISATNTSVTQPTITKVADTSITTAGVTVSLYGVTITGAGSGADFCLPDLPVGAIITTVGISCRKTGAGVLTLSVNKITADLGTTTVLGTDTEAGAGNQVLEVTGLTHIVVSGSTRVYANVANTDAGDRILQIYVTYSL